MPLFVKQSTESIWMIGGGITNFDINEIKKELPIVISMPKTPVIVDENLNKSYCYIPNTEEPDEFDKEYIKSRFFREL
jgi:hypothetical protein